MPPDDRGVVAFKGIPYAKPPVGPRRWRSPEPYVAQAGVRPAQTFGPSCLAAPGPNPEVPSIFAPQSEDCLTLNVWTPQLRRNAGRPVMVWLHGGGFQFGGSANPTYDGAHLAAKDTVVVSLNYRLSVFGFLATNQFDQESGRSGMWGLQDQLLALEWVKDNIREFGGDPNNVTLFGESAGAHAVGLLMTSPRAQGLFSKAIVQSGATWDSVTGSIATHETALSRGEQFKARFAGIDMRSLPAEVINAAAPWDYLTEPPFAPSIDGQVVVEPPAAAFAAGRTLKIPMLGGWNNDEWFPFVPTIIPAAPPDLFYQAAGRLFGQACLPEFRTLYPPTDPTNAQASSLKLNGDMMISEQTWEALRHQGSRRPTYAYRFTYTSPYSPIAVHTAEMPFVFGTMTRQPLGPTGTPDTADFALSETMMRYWTNFARVGDPNGPGLPAWPVLGADGALVMELGNTVSAQANPDRGRFEFLERYRQAGRFPGEWKTFALPYLSQYSGPACPN